MIVSHKYKLCYIGVPKTGSSSVHDFFRQADDAEDFLVYDEHNYRPRFESSRVKHFTSRDVMKYLSEEDKNPEEYKFLYTVRNPYTYAASDFCMMKRNHEPVIQTSEKSAQYASGNSQWVNKCKVFRDMLSASKDDRSLFSTFLNTYYKTSSLYHPYVAGVPDSQLAMIKFESLQKDFNKHCQQLIDQSRDFKLGFVNANNETEAEYRELYDPTCRINFYNQYCIDFKTYGYDKGWLCT